MSKICISFLCILMIYGVSFAQIDSIHNNQENRIENHKSAWIIKWAPSSLFTPETPTMQFGLEFMPRVNRNISLELDYAFKCIVGTNEWDGRFDRQYDKYSIEIRYYLHSPIERRRVNFFMALEGFHVNYKYATQKRSYTSANNINYGYDFARTTKLINGLSAKAGFVFKFNFPVWLECFAGIGMRNVSVEYSDVANKREIDNFDQSLAFPIIFSDSDNLEGQFLRPHISLGLKASYKF
jgi:hypothetical protein